MFQILNKFFNTNGGYTAFDILYVDDDELMMIKLFSEMADWWKSTWPNNHETHEDYET